MRIQLLYNALCHHVRHTGGTREVLIDCSLAEQSRNLTEGRILRKKKKKNQCHKVSGLSWHNTCARLNP